MIDPNFHWITCKIRLILDVANKINSCWNILISLVDGNAAVLLGKFKLINRQVCFALQI